MLLKLRYKVYVSINQSQNTGSVRQGIVNTNSKRKVYKSHVINTFTQKHKYQIVFRVDSCLRMCQEEHIY